MKVILGGVYQPTLEGASVRISRSMSDPVPTCSINLRDNTSAIQVKAMQELLVLDDQVIPNPTTNLLLNPSMNPYNSNGWGLNSPTGVVTTQIGGGGMQATFTNATPSPFSLNDQELPFGSIIPGQTYVFSVYGQGSSSPTNIGLWMQIKWVDAAGIASTTQTFSSPIPISTSLTRYSITATAPAPLLAIGTPVSSVIVSLGYVTSSGTNSGVISYTQPQIEPVWFPTLSYPTPWCGPAQTNCRQLPLGQWIRQYRKFAGLIPMSTAGNYHGNVRTLQISAVGYAWLTGIISCNNSYSSKTDSFIIGDLTSTYMTNLVNTTNVITGVTVSNLQSNWDDLRTLFDGLCGLSGSYWTIGYYWEFVYAPPGYLSMPISLICDGSGTPDNITTFPAYNFSADSDYTQPGSQILVIGAGTNVARVIDPSTIGQNALVSGYTLPNLTTGGPFWRKVNDSTLNSVADCTQRGMAELLQYDYPRGIYHLTTNVELLPGQSIQVTSNTDNLNKTTLLIQQVTAQWLGTNELLQDEWAYSADLGATNRSATNIISRIHRITQKNTSAPAISSTTLAVVENVSVMDSIDGGSLYAQTVLADSPIAYYRLGEPTGFSITTAYDWGGNTYNGTYNGGFTLGQTGAIYNDSNTAVLFDGSTGNIVLNAGLNTSGWTSISFECWVNLTNNSFGGYPGIGGNDRTDSTNNGFMFFLAPASDGKTGYAKIGFGASMSTVGFGSGVLSLGWHYLTFVYNGSTILAYIDGVQAGNTSTAGALTAGAQSVHLASYSDSTNYLSGTIDEVAIYKNIALSSTRITAHYSVGKLGHS